ncbi:MAG: hypothetical protein OHK0022_08110 [Roseiflexaceae bacterium]
MSELPELAALVLRLRPQPGCARNTASGQHAQALFLDLVAQIDPARASLLHAGSDSRPYTVALLERQPEQAGGCLELRVSLLGPELFATLYQSLLRLDARRALRLGHGGYLLAEVLGTPEQHPWAGWRSFGGLLEQVRPVDRLTLEFATPAAFSRGELADGRARLWLLPDPASVFGSLSRRWNSLAPAAAHLDPEAVAVAADQTLLSYYADLNTRQISLGRGPQKGFVGRCTYELPPDPQQRRLLTLLADAARFLGVGIKTARGMGLCRRVAGREAPRTQNQETRTESRPGGKGWSC